MGEAGMKQRDYTYAVVLHVVHHEPPNPDEPTLNINALAEAIAIAGQGLTSSEIDVTVSSTRLVSIA